MSKRSSWFCSARSPVPAGRRSRNCPPRARTTEVFFAHYFDRGNIRAANRSPSAVNCRVGSPSCEAVMLARSTDGQPPLSTRETVVLEEPGRAQSGPEAGSGYLPPAQAPGDRAVSVAARPVRRPWPGGLLAVLVLAAVGSAVLASGR